MKKKIYSFFVIVGIIILLLSILMMYTIPNAIADEVVVSGDTSQEELISLITEEGTSDNEIASKNEEAEPSVWTVYLKEKILPGVVFVITAAFLCWTAISPILSKFIKSINNFKEATSAVLDANKKADKSSEDMRANSQEISKAFDNHKEQVNKDLLEMREQISDLLSYTKQITEILKIGFGNMDELVKKGCASEVLKVGDLDDKKIKKTIDNS